jgi:hypothetical protein
MVKGLIKFVVVDGIHLSVFNVMWHNGMNSIKKKNVKYPSPRSILLLNTCSLSLIDVNICQIFPEPKEHLSS